MGALYRMKRFGDISKVMLAGRNCRHLLHVKSVMKAMLFRIIGTSEQLKVLLPIKILNCEGNPLCAMITFRLGGVSG